MISHKLILFPRMTIGAKRERNLKLLGSGQEHLITDQLMIRRCIQRLEDFKVVLSNVTGDTNPKSQMWMGTYPTNPSYVIPSGLPLADYLKQNPQVIGVDRWGAEIPFLSKVSSFTTDESWREYY